MDYINISLKVPNFSLENNVFFPNLPAELEKKINYMQFLLFMKHFRPEELPRFIKFFYRNAFTSIIETYPTTNFDDHCLLDWLKRPTILFYHYITRSLFEYLELKSMRHTNRYFYKNL